MNTIKKYLTVTVILLFIGVAIAPSIQVSGVKAAREDDHVEVTSEACGIKGFGDTTVKLTREQYSDLEQYLAEFREQLNTTTTREEAIPIFNDVINELNKYGLLPKGMSIEQAQKLVIHRYSKGQEVSLLEEISHKNSRLDYHNTFCCLVAGVVQDGSAMGILSMIGMILLLLSIFPSPFPFISGNPLFFLLGGILTVIGFMIVTFSPLALMQQVIINSGNMTAVGLGGIIHFNEGLLNGFNGIKITRISTKETYLLGFSFMVSYQSDTI
jgi:hypothetical protein